MTDLYVVLCTEWNSDDTTNVTLCYTGFAQTKPFIGTKEEALELLADFRVSEARCTWLTYSIAKVSQVNDPTLN